jgi:hypothetical protein
MTSTLALSRCGTGCGRPSHVHFLVSRIPSLGFLGPRVWSLGVRQVPETGGVASRRRNRGGRRQGVRPTGTDHPRRAHPEGISNSENTSVNDWLRSSFSLSDMNNGREAKIWLPGRPAVFIHRRPALFLAISVNRERGRLCHVGYPVDEPTPVPKAGRDFGLLRGISMQLVPFGLIWLLVATPALTFPIAAS